MKHQKSSSYSRPEIDGAYRLNFGGQVVGTVTHRKLRTKPLLEVLMEWLGVRKDIIGRQGSPLITRWDILGTRNKNWPKIFLHQLHRSDPDVPHDHPWVFWSLILFGGYTEWAFRPSSSLRRETRKTWLPRWCPPGTLLRNPADWAHRIEIDPGKEAWSLVWAGLKVRGWGFHTPCGWLPWKEHERRTKEFGKVCPDE